MNVLAHATELALVPWQLTFAPAGVSLPPLILEAGPVTERLRVREIDDDEGGRLVRIIRRGSGSVVAWRRAQMVLLSAQGMGVPAIAKVAFTSEDRVRDVIRDFNADGFGSLAVSGKGKEPGRAPRPRMRATVVDGANVA
jgi:winged helix-turn helix protein